MKEYLKLNTVYKVERCNSWLKNTCVGKYVSLERAEHEMFRHYLKEFRRGNFHYRIKLQHITSAGNITKTTRFIPVITYDKEELEEMANLKHDYDVSFMYN